MGIGELMELSTGIDYECRYPINTLIWNNTLVDSTRVR